MITEEVFILFSAHSLPLIMTPLPPLVVWEGLETKSFHATKPVATAFPWCKVVRLHTLASGKMPVMVRGLEEGDPEGLADLLDVIAEDVVARFRFPH